MSTKASNHFSLILPISEENLKTISVRDIFILACYSLQTQVNSLVHNPEETHENATANLLFELQGQYVNSFKNLSPSDASNSFYTFQLKTRSSYLEPLCFGSAINLNFLYRDGSPEKTLFYQMDQMRKYINDADACCLNSSFSETSDLDVLLKDKDAIALLWNSNASEWRTERKMYS